MNYGTDIATALSWPELAGAGLFVVSGLALLLLAYFKTGERARRLTARLSALAPKEEVLESQPIAPRENLATLYREEKGVRSWPAKLKKRIVPIAAISLLSVVVLAVAFTTYPLASLITVGVGVDLAVGVFCFRLYRKKARRRKFVEQLPEAIDIIIRGARVGMSLLENFQVVAREMPDPVGGEFRILAEKLSIGIDLETALNATVETVGVKELQFMATTLVLQRRTGGQYAEVLENLAKLLRDRRAQYLKARALTSEARMSARIVTGVTGIILLILALTNRAQFDFLLTDPLGHNLLIYAGGSLLLGFFVISRLLRTLQ